MQRTSKIAENSGFIPAEACGLQDDVILLCFGIVNDTTTMKFTGCTYVVHCNSLPVVVVVLKFPIKDLDHWTSSSSSLVKPARQWNFILILRTF